MPPDAAPPADAGPRVRPRVLIIVGSGRSGSTLIERALGEVPGVAPLGETVHMWERGVRDSELCGCGQPFGTCPFWQSVGQVAFGGWHQIDAQVAIDEVWSALRFRPEADVRLAELGRRIEAHFGGVHAAQPAGPCNFAFAPAPLRPAN